MSKVLVFSRDPAPTNLLIALIERLRQQAQPGEAEGLRRLRAVAGLDPHFVVQTRRSSAQLWAATRIQADVWEGSDAAAAAALVRSSGADSVLTGTSDSDEFGNQLLWSAAQESGLQSHVVLDHPGALDSRFRMPDGMRILPDRIYVPDEIFRSRVAGEGFPPAKIEILGDLNLERLRARAKARTEDEKLALRNAWGAADGDTVVLFVSECMQEMKALGLRSFSYDYDEVELLRELLRTLSAGKLPDGRAADPRTICVVIRPHPRDVPGKYDSAIASQGQAPSALVSSEGDADLAIAAADLVVGMTSSLLFEAKALKYPVHSLLGIDLTTKSQVR